MLKNENIICISSIDWDFIWQGHQEIMSTLAKNGNRVIFIENTGVRAPGIRDISRLRNRIINYRKGVKGTRKVEENLYVLSPLVLPFPYLRVARWINRKLIVSLLQRLMKSLDFGNPVVWTFLPTPLSLGIINSLDKKITIYYCIDNFRVSSAAARKIEKSEVNLLKSSDLVFVTSNELYNYCSKYNNKVSLFPFAVSYEKFEEARLSQNETPNELIKLKKPIIGYVGGIHKWIDQSLIKEVSQKRKNYSFVFVGPVQTDISLLSSLENVYFLGKKEHGRLPFYIKNFAVGIIPYVTSEYTKNVYPTKLNEYFAMGKPVISTGLTEVIAFNKRYSDSVCVVSNSSEFAQCIDSVLEKDDSVLQNRRIEIAKENSWGSSIEKMCNIVVEEIENRKDDIRVHWKEKILDFYQKAQRKAVISIVVILLVYLALFKTSFIWFLAEPLRISEAPRKVDAIVVFGGGVGETGNPGKSTIERARYAADLYNQGYADKIIFSSGYTYKYVDAENMRLIAFSMGVEDEDIILEKKAQTAYENAVRCKDILDDNNWNSISLVSSPYNMRRASLVFRKCGKDIEVTHTPVKECQFYDRGTGNRLVQIKAIWHEYLGILYYWWKGWI